MGVEVWNEEEIEFMKTRWEDYSSTVIAAQMSAIFKRPFTRNMIISKARRLGLAIKVPGHCKNNLNGAAEAETKKKARGRRKQPSAPRSTPTQETQPVATAGHSLALSVVPSLPKPPKPVGAVPPTPPKLVSDAPEREVDPADRLRLWDLRPNQCRWSIGHDEDGHYFCGEITSSPKQSWCDCHHARGWIPNKPVRKVKIDEEGKVMRQPTANEIATLAARRAQRRAETERHRA